MNGVSRWALALLVAGYLPLSLSASSGQELGKLAVRSQPAESRQGFGPGRVQQRDVGTKDAPVDGLDGKPHAGPFVEVGDQTQAKSDDIRNTNTKVTPEDGVMNDPNRVPPKKGTTGTEGGVSEKERDRRVQEATGEKTAKVPDQPKSGSVTGGNHEPALDRGTADAGSTAYGEAKGFGGLDKPEDLPETPHEVSGSSGLNDAQVDAALLAENQPRRTAIDESDDLIPWDALAGSFSSIAATEIGDKTFIVAALMAMRHSRLQVFSAAFSALLVMTILSGLAGHLVGAVISQRWSALVAALLFLVFGAKSLREGFEMSPDQGVSDEIREVEAELEEKEIDMARHGGHRRGSTMLPYALEAGRPANGHYSHSNGIISPASRSPSPSRPSVDSFLAQVKNLFSLLLSPAWVETFSMTFFGELGDRSQIATVAMAAGQEYLWVMVGATLGHFVCTGVAVVGGSVLAGRVSLRKVTLTGGCIFIGFGLFTLLEAMQYWS